ncbi:GAF and ANTAR domain-containing protein [Saccharothrix sp. BKS2]|uniref:GAF and ANTAR domain-containing protein n=1 Tax=Saccharothrix sp. BKS2 TaxID=3064400 RepID=UPI0039EA38FD
MTSGRSPADELAAVFVRVSGLLLTTDTVNTALELLTSLARETFPASDGAGLTLLGPTGDRVSAAATDPRVEVADALQYELGQGPCLAAWDRRAVVRVDDVLRDDRWPEWGRAAAGVGVRSVLSAPMVAGSEGLGAMKVYASVPGAYGEREERLLTMFATQCAVMLANVRTAEDARRVSDRLKEVLRERDVIALGKGIVMARDGVDEQAAFLVLADEARRDRTTLRQAAERLVRSTTHDRR